MLDRVGQVLDDKYRPVRCIGSGGMGSVYEGEHLAIGKRVAVKFMHGPPVDVAGAYTLTLVNGENGCALDGWRVGEESRGVPFTLTQNDTELLGTVDGLAGTYLQLVVGSNQLEGEIHGNTFELSLTSDRQQTAGACVFLARGDMHGTSTRDTIEGTIEYSYVIVTDSDCGDRGECVTEQSFNGTRPPR